jgi:putative phage-type endonuclease
MADLIPTASEAEWLAARRKGITASEIAALMGISPWSSPYKLYHQKLGLLPADEVTPAMERGNVLEPYVVEKFAAAHPEFAVLGTGRELYAHPSRPWQMATPDRMVHDVVEVDRCTCGTGPMGYYGMHERHCGWELDRPVAVLETKTTTDMSEWGEPGTDEIPVHYRSQVLWQMDVMGVSRAYVAVLDIRQWEVSEYAVSHIDGCGPGRYLLAYPSLACPACDDVVLMREKAQEFIKQMESGDIPDADWSAATAYALKQLHPSLEDRDAHIGRRLEISYRAAIRHYKDAEQRKDEMTNRLREAMGSASRAVAAGTVGSDGKRVVIATRQVYDQAAKTIERKASTVDKLVPAKQKKES